jgi:hypothetical protein
LYRTSAPGARSPDRRISIAAPITLQLCTIREDLPHDFTGVIKTVADIGCIGIEVQEGFEDQGTITENAAEFFKALGL